MATFSDADIAALITEYENLRNTTRRLSEDERERLQALRDQLTVLGEIEKLSTAEIQHQEKIRDD